MHAPGSTVRRAGCVAISFLVLIAAFALSAGEARGADSGERIARPNLAGHTFLPTDLVPEAFVRTYVRNTLGYAAATNLDYPVIIVDADTLISLEGDLAYATLSLDYQQTVKDWIALRITLDGRTRLGTELSSIILDGVTVSSGTRLGWLIRIDESKRTMLSGSLGILNQTYTRIDVEGFVEDVLAGVPNPRIIDDVPALRTFAGAHLAWAISRPFGFAGTLEGSYGETPWRDQPEGWGYEYGLAVDFDAGAAWRVPVGAALAYRQISTPLLSTEGSSAARTGVLRIAYNAQRDFVVGVDLSRTSNREGDRGKTISSFGAALTLRYYF